MTIEEQYKMMFPRRITSGSMDFCKKISCKDYEDCTYPCDLFDTYVRLLTMENLIYGREEGEKK